MLGRLGSSRRARLAGSATFASLVTLGLALSLGAGGCASGGAGRAGDPDAVAAAVAGTHDVVAGRPVNAGGSPTAYLALGGVAGARVRAFDLATSRTLWTAKGDVTGRIVAGRTIIAHAEGPALVGRAVSDGHQLWRFPVSAPDVMVGYCADGDDVYLVTREGEDNLRGGHATLIAIGGAGGGVRWRRALATGHVAAPAARGGLVAVPNRSQFVSLFDGRNGAPVAQVLSKEQTANFVRALPEGLFYGFNTEGAFLVSGATASGSRSSGGYLHARLPPFVRPVYDIDAYRTELLDYSAVDRNRVLWRAAEPDASGTTHFLNNVAVVLNYRFFFGFDAATGELRWAYNHPVVEAAGAANTGDAIVFATVNGELGALDARNGRRTYEASMPGEVVKGVTFDAEGFAPRAPDAEVTPVAEVLRSILWDPDRRFAEVKMFAVDQMAKLPGRAVTADLMKAIGKEGVTPAVAQRAAEALIARHDRSSADLFAEALQVHSDYVEDVRAANLDILARATASAGARSAAPALAAHLGRPETSPAAVAQIARALSALAAKDQLGALEDYLMIYRADPIYEGDPGPLLAVTDAIVALGGVPDRELLFFVAEEPKTLRPLREYVREALAQTVAPGQAAAAPAPAVGGAGSNVPGRSVSGGSPQKGGLGPR